jgi:hypothetical protein
MTTRPLKATTLSPTLPETSTSPLNTTRLRVTLPSTVASPLKITAVATLSPSGTTSVPVRTISSSAFGWPPSSWPKAAEANGSATSARVADAITNVRSGHRVRISTSDPSP